MRTRLIVVAFAVTSMVAVAFVVPLMTVVRGLAADREISAAERDAVSVARVVTVVGTGSLDELIGPVISPKGMMNGRPITIAVIGGTTIGAPLPPGEDVVAAAEGSKLRQAVPGGEAIYVAALAPSGETVVVRVVAAQDAMREGVFVVWLILIGLAAILVVLAVGVADRMGVTMVRPVDRLAEAADRMGSGDLEARVEVAGPEEIRRVGTAFNRLAAQIANLLQRERETAADLSHRLRTPLTGARLNADALPESERKRRLIDQLDEIERVVDHVIDEIRRPDRQARSTVTDVGQIAADRVAFWEPLASDEDRDLIAAFDVQNARVAAPEEDVAAALDALIGNVFAHTDPGTDFSVAVRRDGTGFVDLVVEDAGEGLPSDLAMAERGSSGGDSTGLGLDIARQTAMAAGGDLLIGRSALGGASITMRLHITPHR